MASLDLFFPPVNIDLLEIPKEIFEIPKEVFNPTIPGTVVSSFFDFETKTRTDQIGAISGDIRDFIFEVPAGTITNTVFNAKAVNSTFTGNDESNRVEFTEKARGLNFSSGAGADEVIFDKSIGSDVNLGEGNDDISATNKVKDSTIDAGSGDDSLVFGGIVRGSDILGGEGADTFTFKDKIKDVSIDLGGDDGSSDTIKIKSLDDIKGLVITGADQGDVLIIGGEEYGFDPSSGGWVSGNDTLFFN